MFPFFFSGLSLILIAFLLLNPDVVNTLESSSYFPIIYHFLFCLVRLIWNKILYSYILKDQYCCYQLNLRTQYSVASFLESAFYHFLLFQIFFPYKKIQHHSCLEVFVSRYYCRFYHLTYHILLLLVLTMSKFHDLSMSYGKR